MDTTPQFWSDAAHAEKTSEQAHEVRERLARVSGTGTAARGDVRVTVGMGGRLTGVVIAGAPAQAAPELNISPVASKMSPVRMVCAPVAADQ